MIHGGIGFIIVKFTKLDKTYLLYIEDLLEFINNEDRKSIPLEYFNEKGILLKEGINPRYDYLKVINERISYEEN
jgi:recombination protein U